jgi:hypothetical protein
MQGPSTLGGGGDAPDPAGSVPRRGPSASIREEAKQRNCELTLMGLMLEVSMRVERRV